MAIAESKKKAKNSLIGATAKPTALGDTSNIGIDTAKTIADSIITAGETNNLDLSSLNDFTSISNARDQIYDQIDTMSQDSSVSAVLRTYTEDVCEPADNGHIVWAESNDPKISKFINYILNVMNVDKYIYSWTYCLLKYGDVYLKLYRESDYDDRFFKRSGIDKAEDSHRLNEDLDESIRLNLHKTNDKYTYYAEMVPDPSTMFELTKYGKTYGYIEVPNSSLGLNMTATYETTAGAMNQGQTFNYRYKSGDVNIWQADDYVHGCLEDGVTRYPETVSLFMSEDDYKTGSNGTAYTVKRGKSLLYDSYKVWRERSLLEASVLLNRITRSSVVRKVAVEVGDMPKEQVQLTLRRVKELFEQKSALDTGSSFSEYTNPGPIENNIYYATYNGKGQISVDSVGGDINVKDLADLDNWTNKFYAAFGIPKQYFGETNDSTGFNGGSALSVISSVYAKGVKRVQNVDIQMLTDAVNLILINKGLRSYVNNFTLKMHAPLTQEEINYRENLTNRISAISNMTSLFADIEDKSRRLRILKDLVSTLNYGDDILEQIQGEIDDAEKQKETAKAEQEAETASQNAKESQLPPLGEALDKNSLINQTQFVTESDDLPTPETADKNIDFTDNNTEGKDEAEEKENK